MKTKILSKMLSLGLAFVLVSAITQVHGGSSESSAYSTSPQDVQLPVSTIHSTGDGKGEMGSRLKGRVAQIAISFKKIVPKRSAT
jgi:hypothetical protein